MGRNKIDIDDIQKYNKTINQISEIRRLNNENWMEVLRLCFKHSPKEAKEIFKKITKNDKEINKLSKELCK